MKTGLILCSLLSWVSLCIGADGISSPASRAPFPQSKAATDETLAAFGIDSFRKTHRHADGRNVRIAIFDSGVRPGVPGIQNFPDGQRKLRSIRDFTGFGAVKTDAASNIGLVAPQSFQTLRSGLLAESTLSKQAGAPIDLNSNGTRDDVFPFLLGLENGQIRVYIDLDRDGVLKPESEMLSDFETTGKHIAPHASFPSGVAATVYDEATVQFHLAVEPHGTWVAQALSGTGPVLGIASGAQIDSYVVWPIEGQPDFSTLKKMFLDARDRGNDIIQISWSFEFESLEQAQDFADFLERELIQKGVLIVFSAGNSGPALGSSGLHDYIPPHGYAIGTLLTPSLGRAVLERDWQRSGFVASNSSVGPSAGGRQLPDFVSPAVCIVSNDGESESLAIWFPYTSCAAPVFSGALATIASQAKADGLPIIPGILKWSLAHTSQVIDKREAFREGRGLINVERGYELYARTVRLGSLQIPELRVTILSGGSAVMQVDQDTRFALRVNAVTGSPDGEYKIQSESGLLSHARDLQIEKNHTASLEITLNSQAAASLPTGSLIQDTLQFFYGDTLAASVPVIIARTAVIADGVRLQGTVDETQIGRYSLRLAQAGRIRIAGVLKKLSPQVALPMLVLTGRTKGHLNEMIMGTSKDLIWTTDPLPAGDYELDLINLVLQGTPESAFSYDIRVELADGL